jgi:hypothetical protein
MLSVLYIRLLDGYHSGQRKHGAAPKEKKQKKQQKKQKKNCPKLQTRLRN